MVAPAIASCAAGKSCVGPGVKRRFLRIMMVCTLQLKFVNKIGIKQIVWLLRQGRSTTPELRLDCTHLHPLTPPISELRCTVMHGGPCHSQLRGRQELRGARSKKTIFENHDGMYPATEICQ